MLSLVVISISDVISMMVFSLVFSIRMRELCDYLKAIPFSLQELMSNWIQVVECIVLLIIFMSQPMIVDAYNIIL